MKLIQTTDWTAYFVDVVETREIESSTLGLMST